MKRFGLYSLLLLLVFAFLNVAAVITLPHDKFVRYQSLNDGEAPTSYWVYERIHFDPTPIDIAFVGTSRTGLSLHSRRLEEDLARRGVAAKAVTLYQVRSGINMQYVLVKELLDNRKVKLLVLEMAEREERKSHEDFIYLADSSDILSEPIFINPSYLLDVSRLPGRQVKLFLRTQLQRLGWSGPEFVLPPYVGPNLDHAEFITTLDGVRHPRDDLHTREEMEELRIKEERSYTPTLLPIFLSDIEFRIPRYYEQRILDLAQAHGTKVAFLYAPRYGGPEQPPPFARYQERAQLINPWSQLNDPRFWADENHVNWTGAQRMTDFVADALARRVELH